MFQSPERRIKREFDFKKDLFELKKQIEEGQTEFTKTGEAKIAKYLISTRIERGGQLKISFNDGAIQDAMKYFGYFALVSNQSFELFTSLEYYRLREKNEELFANQKGSFDSQQTETVKVRLSTETIERDRLFWELLGVLKK